MKQSPSYCAQFIFNSGEEATLTKALTQAKDMLRQTGKDGYKMGIWKLVAVIDCEVKVNVTPIEDE